MHACWMRRLFMATGACVLVTVGGMTGPFAGNGANPAQAASRSERFLYGLEIVVSPDEGRSYVAREGELIAIGTLGGQDTRARRGGYEECVPGYGCRIVGGYADGYGDPYYDGYGGYGYAPQFVLTGRDLTLKSIDSANLLLPASANAYDPLMDHWRILYERTGTLETNPAPLVATAQLLEPLAQIDPVTTASTSGEAARGPVRIEITRRNARDVTSDIQKLLNELGHDAGPPDGLSGRNTEAAIRRFQAARGIEVTGRMTPSLIDAIYRAADKVRPQAGRMIVRRAEKTVLDEAIDIDADDEALGTHLFVLADRDGRTGWQLVTLSRRIAAQDDGALAAEVFGFERKQDHASAAVEALGRIHIPAKVRAQVVAMVTPGSTMVLADETLRQQISRR